MQDPRSLAPKMAIAALKTVLFAAALLLASPAALAQDSAAKARAHYQSGKQLFAKGDYKAAIAEFAAADNLAPSPILEFNIALCYEKQGDKAEAVRRYKLYLEKMPSAANKADVESKIATLEKELEAERKAAEKAKKPPPDQPLDPELYPAPATAAVLGGGDDGEEEKKPASTGDAELDRVAAIDVAAIRDERMGAAAGETGEPPPSAGPPPSGGPEAGGATAAGTTSPAPTPAAPKDDDDPVYKKWWFWVVIGVSAIILIDFARDDSGSSSSNLVRPVLPPQSSAPDQTGGAVLMRF